MNAKQTRFVAEYLIDLNATQAAIRAGYSPRTAEQQSYQLLQKTSVAAAVSAAKAKQLADLDFDAKRILQEMGRLALVDRRGYYNEDGTPKAMKDLTEAQGAALQDVEILIRNVAAGDGKSDMVHKFRTWDKPRCLEMLAKHFGLLTDKLEHTGGIEISWKSNE